jgi:hypothetical protein
MERFDALLPAAEFAATRCKRWKFANSDETYDVDGLLVLADTADSEDPIDEDCFYVVSPGGAIGLCNYGEDIDWLFLPDSGIDEDLPAAYQSKPQVNFCPKCGKSVVPGARFCGQCGAAL